MPQILQPFSDMISWVIGRGGLLGRNVELALRTKGAIWHPREPFTWDSPPAAERELSIACRAFAEEIGNSPWQIAWCAGTGVVGSSSSGLAQETRAFACLLKCVTEELCQQGKSSGAMFLASSAGGVYAGVGTPPFCEDSPVAPLAPYGWSKLEQESLARQWSKETATPLLIGRLSNLYGPGQKLSKQQGLITQVCLRVLSRQPIVLYVPLDTIRDYLFAKDAGALVADGLTRLRYEASQPVVTTPVVKILASQQPTTVSTVLAQLRWVTKRPVRVIIAESPNAARQARDLRMTSSVWPELDRRPITTLSEGMRWVLTDMLNSSALRRTGLDASVTAGA
jgi:UDP-glucose 4-epimerase